MSGPERPVTVRSFHGYFPKQFVDADVWSNFPTVKLQPGAPAYVWLKLRSSGEAPAPGLYTMRLEAIAADGTLSWPVQIEVLRVRMPAVPLIESRPYGTVNDQDGREHHTTIDGGHRHYMIRTILLKMDNPKRDVPGLAAEAPEQLRQNIRRAVDKIYDEAGSEGYRKDQVLLSMFDEQHDARTEEWLILAREVKAYDPAALIISNPVFTRKQRHVTLQGTIEPLLPLVDVWQPHLTLLQTQPREAEVIMRSGRRIWAYRNVGIQLSRSERAISAFYRRVAYYVRRYPLTGISFWSARRHYGDMWNDHDRDRLKDWPDAAVVFPNEEGNAMTTRNWEAWREAIEDVAIEKMLGYALDNKQLDHKQAEEACALLQDDRPVAAEQRKARALAILAKAPEQVEHRKPGDRF